MTDPGPLLLMAPSRGLGGGIERVAEAVEASVPDVTRVDLRQEPDEDLVAQTPLHLRLAFAARVLAAALRRRPRAVLILHVNLLPVGHLAALVSRAPPVMLGHGREVWGPMGPFRRWLVRRCSRLLAVSNFTAHWLARRAGISEHSVEVIRLPVDARFARLAESTGKTEVPPTGSTFLTVSRISVANRYKGHLAIAQALPRVLDDEPAARWLVVGGGNDLETLRGECERLGVAGAVEFRGQVDDAGLLQAYREAAFFVMPSVADPKASPPIGEGFGLVYLEAASLGLPSIGSEAGGGSAEFISHEETGLTVPENDPAALAAAIVRLLRDDSLRERLGAGARARLRERHLPGHFADALRSLLAA